MADGAHLPQPLQTQRLLLRPFGPLDAGYYFGLFNDRDVRRYLWDDSPVSWNQVESVRAESDRTFTTRGFGVWTVTFDSGIPIGFGGLRFVLKTDRIELLYGLSQEFWGQGYGAEAVSSVLTHAFNTLTLDIVEASTHPGNTRSVALLRRVGMTETRTEETPVGPLLVFTLTRADYSPRIPER